MPPPAATSPIDRTRPRRRAPASQVSLVRLTVGFSAASHTTNLSAGRRNTTPNRPTTRKIAEITHAANTLTSKCENSHHSPSIRRPPLPELERSQSQISPAIDSILVDPRVQSADADLKIGSGDSDGLAGTNESDRACPKLGRLGSGRQRDREVPSLGISTRKDKNSDVERNSKQDERPEENRRPETHSKQHANHHEQRDEIGAAAHSEQHYSSTASGSTRTQRQRRRYRS